MKDRFAAWNSPNGWADVSSRLNGVASHVAYVLGALAYLYAGYTVTHNSVLCGLWSIPGIIGLNMWVWSVARRSKPASENAENCDEFG